MNHREMMARLNAALNHVDASYAAIGKRYGLTFNALMMVYLIVESKGITQKQLCDALHLPKSTVHSILREWLETDYVQLREGGNKKEKLIAITATGGKFFERIRIETDHLEKNVLDAFGEENCSFFLASAERLAELLQNETAKEYSTGGSPNEY